MKMGMVGERAFVVAIDSSISTTLVAVAVQITIVKVFASMTTIVSPQ